MWLEKELSLFLNISQVKVFTWHRRHQSSCFLCPRDMDSHLPDHQATAVCCSQSLWLKLLGFAIFKLIFTGPRGERKEGRMIVQPSAWSAHVRKGGYPGPVNIQYFIQSKAVWRGVKERARPQRRARPRWKGQGPFRQMWTGGLSPLSPRWDLNLEPHIP